MSSNHSHPESEIETRRHDEHNVKALSFRHLREESRSSSLHPVGDGRFLIRKPVTAPGCAFPWWSLCRCGESISGLGSRRRWGCQAARTPDALRITHYAGNGEDCGIETQDALRLKGARPPQRLRERGLSATRVLRTTASVAQDVIEYPDFFSFLSFSFGDLDQVQCVIALLLQEAQHPIVVRMNPDIQPVFTGRKCDLLREVE